METKLYNLTHPQRSIWLTEQFHENTAINNVAGTLTINQEINMELLEKAILLFISSNEALKLKLDFSQKNPMQYVSTDLRYSIKCVEINDENELKDISKKFTKAIFNLKNSFLFDFLIFKFKDNSKGGFMAKLHHLISDAWSMSLLINQIVDIYSNLLKNIPLSLNTPSYLEYMQNEKQYLSSDKFEKDKKYWDNLFNTTPELTSLSKNFDTDNSNNTPKALRRTFSLTENESNLIKEYCKTNKISPYTFFMTILGVYTSKLNNTDSIILGTPVLNRTNFKEKNTIGMFISTIPFKMNINFSDSFTNILQEVSKTQLNYFRHQKYPYEYLLETIREKYNITNNLYTTVLSYHNAKDNRKTSDISYDTEWHFNGNISEELEIHISDLDDNNIFNFIYDYRLNKFNEDDIIKLHNRLMYIIEQIFNNNNILAKDIEIITQKEKNDFFTLFNNTHKDYPQDKNLIEIFYENVIKYPEQTALVYNDENITYKNLYKKVCAIEKELVKNNVNFQDIVAIYMPKSIEYIASILAVLKLGAIYLPVSYDYPEERIKYMFEDSKTKLIITKNKIDNIFNINMIDAKSILYKDENVLPPKHIEITNSAYIIYTSGSTGKPKGVEVSQKSLINHIYGIYDRFNGDFSDNDITLSIANTSFDANVQEIFIPLFFGATLHLLSEDSIYDPRKLADYIHDKNITFTFIPPTILNAVYNNLQIFNDLKLNKLLVGVQSIKNTLLNKYIELIPGLKIHNGYGPTETTICCISRMYNEIISDRIFNIPIGKPMNNCEVYLLNNNLTLQPFGYVGEICIAGDCLAKGYLYNKEKTEQSFIYCSNLNKTIYRTGDYGYYLPNGEIVYNGRIDMQVKLNGYRIELAEIDEVISKYSNTIEYSTSLIYNKKIYTFLISNNINTTDLKHYLKTKLPYYMIPVSFVGLEKIPSTQNGKLDKNFLIKILEQHLLNKEKRIILPTNKIEEYLIKVIAKTLGIPQNEISIHDNFFEIGGDSLSVIKICSALQKDLNLNLPVKKFFELDTIKDIAEYLSTKDTSLYYHIEKCEETLEKYPISSAQKRVYLSSTLADNEKLLYNMPGIITLPDDIDFKKLEEAINKLISKHESLRTYFVKDSTGIYQKILPEAKIDLKIVSVKEHKFKNYIKYFSKEFDLSKAPLLRCEIVLLSNYKKYLLIDMHHIISDGVSTGILVKDLADLYNYKEIEQTDITYKDYSLWENKAIETNMFQTEKEYWLENLKDSELLNLPTDFPRPTTQTYNGDKFQFLINKKLLNKIKYFCNQNNITLYMYMLGAFNILMYNFCRQQNITIGTPIANRVLGKTSDIIGMFVNTLIINTNIQPEMYIKKYFSDLKNKIINDFENQIYPFDELNNDLKVQRTPNINNIFNTMFIYQNSGVPTINFDNYETTIKPINIGISKFDLSIEITPVEKGLDVIFEYCTDLFKLSTIESLYRTYIAILNYIANNHETTIKDIHLMNSEEKNNILYNFNNTLTLYPKNTDIYSLFLEQVTEKSNNNAIFFENKFLTYKELNQKVCELAIAIKNNGVEKNDIVAILIDKSIESIIAILATLKLGAAYLPIDIDYPNERIDYMLTDSQAKILLTTNDYINKTQIVIKTLNIALDNIVIYNGIEYPEIATTQIDTEIPAYIMYTSGSTGKPKGTIIKQKNIIRLVKNTNFIDFKENDHILQTGSIVFDACTFEIFGALLNGLPLYIIKKEDLLNASILQDFIIQNKITIMWLTAPLFNQLSEVNPHMFNSVRCLLTGGDVLSPKHINMVKAANPNLTIINGYGPTENTTFSCCFTIDRPYRYSIPIGKPIANSTCYIVSDSQKLLPIGFPGELWVGGDGVSLGYLNNPSMTAGKFIPNPYGIDTVYQTGDLAKWLPSGNIEFISRIDSQVKIRGFRVELKEIDIKLTSYHSIKEAFTVINTINNEKCISSYIVTAEKDISMEDLKSYLKESLPKYMIPTYITVLDKLPLNTNGKVDKKQLPSPIEKENANKEIILPENKTEEILLEIFKKILNKTNISTTDDFFEIGGDSLGAMKIQIEALSNGLKIEYSDIFKNSTVKELALIIDKPLVEVTAISKDDEAHYLSYNSFLKNNSVDDVKNLKYEALGNILLTGFTGFLGAHILDSFIKKETGIVYCLIRDKDNLPAIERLKNTLHFYFEDKYDKYIGNRIQIVNGDISSENLGLTESKYKKLGNSIQAVIHSAALVKHYGTFTEFEKINIIGTQNIVKLCTDFNLKMMHISTISVSGNVLAEDANVKNNFTEDKIYDESNFYIGQNIENLYVNSKFKGEDIVLDAISKGLKAYILRMGNLTSRFSEGKFQQNHFENAFVNRFKSILQIGYAPEYLLKGYVEFTPIDYCGDAIIDLATHYNHNYSVFHLLNDNHVPMERLCKELNTIGIPMEIVSSEKFKEIINTLLQDESKKDYLQGIINDLNDDQELVYESNVKIKSEFTKKVLKEIGFEWPYIDTTYLKNYFKYLADIGYFNIKITN